MIFGGIDAWLGGGTIEDIVNGILSGGITGFLLGPLAMINRLRPVFIAFGLGSGIKGVYDSIKNGEYDQAAFRATFVILTLWELKKGVWDKRACFTEETLVLTEDGYKQIKDIQEEDFVYSENVETGEKGLKKVAKVFVREVHKLIHVYVDGEEINTTDTHPFWVEGKGWIEAGELKTGDVLRLYTGELKTVEKVEIEVFDRPVKVYNFEVEDWHTYYVTEQGVLVHNAKNYDGNGNTGVGNKGTRSTVKTNLGNEIDITPSKNHSTTTKNPGLEGKPNSSVDILDSNGNIKTRRWYGPDGKQIRDVDFTNHGNPKKHPEWPHEHGPR